MTGAICTVKGCGYSSNDARPPQCAMTQCPGRQTFKPMAPPAEAIVPPKFHPLQTHEAQHNPFVPEAVALRAYEVYARVFGAQPAMVDLGRNCRGGFSVGETIAFLYARSFPKEEWQQRIDEALKRPEPRR